MNTIDNLKSKIIKLQNELNILENKTKYKRWRAERNNTYYCILLTNDIGNTTDDFSRRDNGNYNIGNYYKTQEEAEQARDRLLAIVRINDRITKLNEGWEYNNIGIRYYIYYINGYKIDYICRDGYISSHIIKYCKTSEIAEKIIKEMKNDLDLIFK